MKLRIPNYPFYNKKAVHYFIDRKLTEHLFCTIYALCVLCILQKVF